jgi:hypothetical protein
MTPDTKHGASFGAASSTAELAEALRHIDKRITSPRENATLGAAADRLLKLERECNEERRAYLGASNHRDALQEKLEAGDAYAVLLRDLLMEARPFIAEHLPIKGRIEGALAKNVPHPTTHGSGGSSASEPCDDGRANLGSHPQAVLPNDTFLTRSRHAAGCFNDQAGAVLCQVCGGDMTNCSTRSTEAR